MGSVEGRRAAAVALVALVVAATGCDLFKPREPEAPTGGGIVPNYRSLAGTLETIALAIEDRGLTNGQSIYIGAFADPTIDPVGFKAEFDIKTLIRLQRTGDDRAGRWDRVLEENFYSRLVSRPNSAAYEMRWSVYPDLGNDDSTSEAALLHREYEIFEVQGDASTYIGHGYVNLRLVKASAERWTITEWEDIEGDSTRFNVSEGEVPMGQLRLEL